MDSPPVFRWIVEPTNQCNFTCRHCFRLNNMSPRTDLPLSLYEKLLREARPFHPSHVAITGGEPTLHPDFKGLLALTAKYNCSFSLATNGWNFDRIYPILSQYRKHLTMISFSLDGAEERTHDAIRKQPGAYEQTIKACMLCYYKQIPFGVTTTIHRLNIDEMDAMIRLASKIGAAKLRFGVAQLTPLLVEQKMALSPQERCHFDAQAQDFQKPSSLSVSQTFDFFLENPFFSCATIRMQSLLLDAAGNIRFCCQLPPAQHEMSHPQADVIGSLHDHSLWELHRRFIRNVATFQEDKLKHIESGALTHNEHFPCFYCAKYFGKLDWLKHVPDSAWNR